MSRRLRVEQIKAKQIKEEDEEEDKLKLQRERIYAPIIWQRTGSGFRIEDLKEKYFNETLSIFKNYYIKEEVLYKNAEMKDDDLSISSLLKQLMFQLKDHASIIAIDESDDEIAGVLILRVIHKDNFGRVFSRAQLVEGEARLKCVKLKSILNRKVDIYDKFDCETFLRYYALCVLPDYRRKGLGFEMMKCGLYVARAMHVPVMMGIFSNFKMQKLAKKLGMQVMYEMNYVDMRTKDGELIFGDPGPGNYTCALMAGLVPAPPPPEPPKPKPPDENEKVQKVTRKDKRAIAAKKAK